MGASGSGFVAIVGIGMPHAFTALGAAGAAALIASLLLLALVIALRSRRRRHELYSLPNGKRIYHLRKAETDFLFGEIFGGGGYLYPSYLDERMWLSLAPGDVVVDVGANIGLFALYCAWSPQTKGDVRVLSFECVPSTHAVLARNAALASAAHPRTRIEAHAIGLSDKPHTSTVHHHPNFSIWSSEREPAPPHAPPPPVAMPHPAPPARARARAPRPGAQPARSSNSSDAHRPSAPA